MTKYCNRSFFSYYKFLVLLITLPMMVAGECTCEVEDMVASGEHSKMLLRYKVAGLGSILAAGAFGVALPLVGRRVTVLSPENDVFFMVKAFAAGVILATGFIHILPEAFESFTSPCLGPTATWRNFPFAGFIAMTTAIGSLMVEALATEHSRRVHFAKESGGSTKVVDEEKDGEHGGHVHVHTHATHGHVHGGSIVDAGDEVNKLDLIRHRITAKVLESGIVVHSVIIGISLGTTASVDTIKPLTIALCFHQFFEGMGLGGCISQENSCVRWSYGAISSKAKFKTRAMALMALFFSLTTPIGVGIGLGISGVYHENSPTSLIVQGTFESAAAGILIYMALVDLLASDFMSPRLQENTRIQLGSHISLLLGAGCMSVLAKWA